MLLFWTAISHCISIFLCFFPLSSYHYMSTLLSEVSNLRSIGVLYFKNSVQKHALLIFFLFFSAMFGTDLRRMKLTYSAKTYELRNACQQSIGGKCPHHICWRKGTDFWRKNIVNNLILKCFFVTFYLSVYKWTLINFSLTSMPFMFLIALTRNSILITLF